MHPKHRQMGWTIILAIVLVTTGAMEVAAQSTAPASKTYVVVGTSPVQASNPNAAKNNAIADSKKIAVEQMTAELIPLEVLIQQFAAIDTVVYSQADKFIQYYKMLSERQQGNQYRVLVQAKVSGRMILEKLRSAGILTADTRPLQRLTLTVLGTDQLSSFVLFRSSLSKMAGVEAVKIQEILPNQTTLSVGYRGTAGAFAENLLRDQQEGFTMRVFQESEQSFRIDLAPAEPKPNQG